MSTDLFAWQIVKKFLFRGIFVQNLIPLYLSKEPKPSQMSRLFVYKRLFAFMTINYHLEGQFLALQETLPPVLEAQA